MSVGSDYLSKPGRTGEILVIEPVATLMPTRGASEAVRRMAGGRARLEAELSGIAYRSLNGRARAHVCLTEVCDESGVPVFTRVWLPLVSGFRAIDPTRGGAITFTVTVERQLDGTYRLERPTNITRIASLG